VVVVVENESVPFDRRVWEECRALILAIGSASSSSSSTSQP
jgi:hypothetical protein